MFFLNLISVVGIKSLKITVLFIAVFMTFTLTSCDKEELMDEKSNINILRSFPKNGSIAPHMESPFAVIYFVREVCVDSLKNQTSCLVIDESGRLQSYSINYGDEKTTTDIRISFSTLVKNTKYYVTLRGANLYYRFSFTAQ